MKRKEAANLAPVHSRGLRDETFDLTALMHPAQAFARPMDVVNDIDLTLSEKRAILSAWASDACAVEAVPALRCVPGHAPVRFDDIMEALRVLDQQAAAFRKPQPHYRRVLERRGASPPSHRFDRGDDQGSRLH